MKYRLVAFDMDGTLVVEKSSWEVVHRYFHTLSEARKAQRLYREGKIDYLEFVKRDVGAWPKPLHISKIDEILSRCRLRSGAFEVVKAIHAKGVKTAIVTAGLGLLARKVAARLGVKHVVANELLTDGQGFLTGLGVVNVEPAFKHLALLQLAEGLGFGLDECVAVDDTIQDPKFLQLTGLGLLLGDRRLSRSIKVSWVRSLREVPLFL